MLHNSQRDNISLIWLLSKIPKTFRFRDFLCLRDMQNFVSFDMQRVALLDMRELCSRSICCYWARYATERLLDSKFLNCVKVANALRKVIDFSFHFFLFSFQKSLKLLIKVLPRRKLQVKLVIVKSSA